MALTAAEVTEMIDQVVGEPSLYLRIQRGRELRLRLMQELVLDQRETAPVARRGRERGVE